MAGVLHTWAIHVNQRGKKVVHILQYGPQTRLLKGNKFYLFPFVTVEIVLVLQLLNMDAAAVVQKMTSMKGMVAGSLGALHAVMWIVVAVDL